MTTSFLPFHLGVDTQSQGRVGKWVRSWWRTSNCGSGPGQGHDWGGLPLEDINQNNMFELMDVKAARLWMLPAMAMEVAIELLWDSPLVDPCICRATFYDACVEQRLGEERRHFIHSAGKSPFWGRIKVRTTISHSPLPSCTH